MAKIGILGGTFNPIHNAHIMLANAALSECKLDKVLIMPSGISYLKKEQYVPDGKTRLDMCNLAIENLYGLETSDIEINRSGNTYTFETLVEYKHKAPNDELYFIIGADSLFYIEKWVEVQKIFDLCTIICAMRNSSLNESNDLAAFNSKAEELRHKFKASIITLDVDIPDISSTKIREMFIDNDSEEEITKYIPQKVYNYIVNNRIYNF